MPVLVLVQWPGKSATSSVSVSWAAWCLVAGVLGCLEERNPRKVILPVAVPLLALLFFNFSVKVLPSMKASEWVENWGVVSSLGNSACWTGMILFGTISVLRYSPSIKQWIAPFLFAFHSSSLIAWYLNVLGVWKFWKYSEIPLGFLASHTAWLGWAALSIPILWSWRRWAIIPPLCVFMIYNSYIAVTAFLLALIWASIKTRKLGWILAALSITALILFLSSKRYETSNFVYLVKVRLYTWWVGIKAIMAYPFGLGTEPNAFQKFLLQNSNRQIIPHFASDLIMGVAENGWASIPIVGWVVSKTRLLSTDSFSISLLVAACFAVIQRSMSVSYFGILAWVIWLAWMVDRKEEALA